MKWKPIALGLMPVSLLSLACAMEHGLPAVHAQASIFSQMDAASAHFKSAQADVKYDEYTKIVKSHDLSSGSIYVERSGSSTNMGAVIRGSSEGVSDRVILYGGGLLQMYTAGTNQDDTYKAGANQAKYQSFLTLGFGGSGHDLQSQWTVTDQGPETLDGVKTEKLDLVGKEQSVRDLFSHVTLWLDPTRDVSLKQIFFQPSGDTRTTTYSNIRLNEKIDKAKYSIPKGATKANH